MILVVLVNKLYFVHIPRIQVLSEVVAALRGLTITDEDLKAAKKVLMIELSETMLSPAGVVESIGSQTMYGIDADSNTKADLLSTITVSDVQV